MKLADQILEYKENNGRSIPIVASAALSDFSKRYSNSSRETPEETFTGNFIPGKIYTFDYNTDTKISKSVPFINKMPIVIYCSPGEIKKNGGQIEYFIDLGVTPQYYRAEILTRIYDQYGFIIENNIKNIKGIQKILDLRYKNLKVILRRTGFETSYTGFKREYMKNIRIIDYSDWRLLPYLNIPSIVGQDLNGIYRKYRMKLNPDSTI